MAEVLEFDTPLGVGSEIAYEKKVCGGDDARDRAWPWPGVGSGRCRPDVQFTVCGGSRLRREAGEECRGGAASGATQGKASEGRDGTEDGRRRADQYRWGSVRSVAGAGAGAAFPDFRGRLRDQQAGDGDSG